MSDAAAARAMLETVVRPLVGNPDAITISESSEGDDAAVVLELSLDPADYGRVIGRGGLMNRFGTPIHGAAGVLVRRGPPAIPPLLAGTAGSRRIRRAHFFSLCDRWTFSSMCRDTRTRCAHQAGKDFRVFQPVRARL